MSVIVAGSTSNEKPLNQLELQKCLLACDTVLELN